MTGYGAAGAAPSTRNDIGPTLLDAAGGFDLGSALTFLDPTPRGDDDPPGMTRVETMAFLWLLLTLAARGPVHPVVPALVAPPELTVFAVAVPPVPSLDDGPRDEPPCLEDGGEPLVLAARAAPRPPTLSRSPPGRLIRHRERPPWNCSGSPAAG